MTTQTKLKSAIFPDFPRGSPAISKDGDFMPQWHLQLSSLFQALQRNFSNEGLQLPQLLESDIDTIEQIYAPLVGSHLGKTPNISGKMVYDISNAVPKIFIITFSIPTDPSSIVLTASWKTFTLI